MVRFRVIQDISTVDSSIDETEFNSKAAPEELKEQLLHDTSKDSLRQITIKASVINEDLTEFEAGYVELYLFKEGTLAESAVHEYMDGIDTYMKTVTEILLNSIPYTYSISDKYDLPPNDVHLNCIWSGIMYACEIYPEYKDLGLENYILQNLSGIVGAGTGNIFIRCIASLPERLSAEEAEEAEERTGERHPKNSGIFDLEQALLHNGYEPACNEDSIKKYGADIYIKDYFDSFYHIN